MAEKSLYSHTVIKGKESHTDVPSTRAYRGMSTVGNTSNSYTLYDIGLIKQDLLNHLHIRPGEKLENPNFGTIIWDYLFDPLTETAKNDIVKNITDVVNYDPRIKVDSIVVTEYESGIQVECELTYLPYNISEMLRFRFDQDNQILQ